MALRDILHRHASSVANGGIAEIDSSPSIAEGDARDPYVWSGRGVQEVFVDLANAVLHQCIRSLTGAHRGSRLIMDISAHAI